MHTRGKERQQGTHTDATTKEIKKTIYTQTHYGVIRGIGNTWVDNETGEVRQDARHRIQPPITIKQEVAD